MSDPTSGKKRSLGEGILISVIRLHTHTHHTHTHHTYTHALIHTSHTPHAHTHTHNTCMHVRTHANIKNLELSLGLDSIDGVPT